METRLATKNDAAVLAALHEESFGAARWSPAQINDSLALQTTLALVVQEKETAQGFALCQIAGEDAEFLTFCIVPPLRRKGAGMFLLGAALDIMRQQGVKNIFLEVSADNAAALALYEKAEFRRIGKRVGYYGHGDQAIDAVMMILDL
jgi:[ribosomal protein S18]-alanine N-acetyltransferase